jgi:hypothetical protein
VEEKIFSFYSDSNSNFLFTENEKTSEGGEVNLIGLQDMNLKHIFILLFIVFLFQIVIILKVY